MITLSTMATSAAIGIPGLVSASLAPVAVAVSIPLGTIQNFAINQLALPWVNAVLPLMAPGEGGVLGPTLVAYMGTLVATINNLLVG
jgi:hypothetical protein